MAITNLTEAEQNLLATLMAKDNRSEVEEAMYGELLAKASGTASTTAQPGAVFKNPEEEAVLRKVLAYLREFPKAKAKEIAAHLDWTHAQFQSWCSNPKVLVDETKQRPSLTWLKDLAGAQSQAQKSTTTEAKATAPANASAVQKLIMSLKLNEADALKVLRQTRVMRQIAVNLEALGVWKDSWQRTSYYGTYEPDEIEAGLQMAGFDVKSLKQKL